MPFPPNGIRPPRLTWNSLGSVFTAAQGQYSTVYWPWVVDKLAFPALSSSFAGRYVMYYSTDHNLAAGGIAVATAPELVGPWTNHGQVYVDTVLGFSTETPSVWWDSNASLFRMFYQQAGVGASQSTIQATSTDGLNWIRRPALGSPTTSDGAIIGLPGEYPGDGHTGYAIPIGCEGEGEMIAYHLMGGGDRPHFGVSYSSNYGSTWRSDPRPLLYGFDQVNPVEAGYRVEWNSGHPFTYQDRRWWIGIISEFGSGGSSVLRHVVQAPLDSGMRKLAGRPSKVFPGLPASNVRSVFLFRGLDEQFHLFYQIDNTIFLAVGANG